MGFNRFFHNSGSLICRLKVFLKFFNGKFFAAWLVKSIVGWSCIVCRSWRQGYRYHWNIWHNLHLEKGQLEKLAPVRLQCQCYCHWTASCLSLASCGIHLDKKKAKKSLHFRYVQLYQNVLFIRISGKFCSQIFKQTWEHTEYLPGSLLS